MPHDKNGQLLKAGDRVTLSGTVIAITSEQPEYCNIAFVTDEGMAPDQPGSQFSLNAGMVELIRDNSSNPGVDPVMPSQPPISNEFVAEGCEKFRTL